MASDEAERKSLLYVGTKHEQKAYSDGYTQGRSDAEKDIATLFSLLTDSEREDIMRQYCVCGSKNMRCQCQNDE